MVYHCDRNDSIRATDYAQPRSPPDGLARGGPQAPDRLADRTRQDRKGVRVKLRAACRTTWLSLVGLLTFGVAAGPSEPRPEGSDDLTGPWQLLVDDALVAAKENVIRTYHPFTKHPGNPVMVADRPWEGQVAYLYGTVLPDDRKEGYRMWYHTWAGEYRNLYATSRDGVTWTKPDLGLVEFQGSKANNIFLRRTKEDHLPQVVHTPWEKSPDRRYKLLTYDLGRVVLYLDGEEIGHGRIEAGATHLSHDRTVVRHFEQPAALTKVGVHLASDLFLGGDAGGRFVTYQDEVAAPPQAALSGFVDDVLVTRTVLNAAAIRRLSREGPQLCKQTQQ